MEMKTMTQYCFWESIKLLNAYLREEVCGGKKLVYFPPWQYLDWGGSCYALGHLTYRAEEDAPQEALDIADWIVEHWSCLIRVDLESDINSGRVNPISRLYPGIPLDWQPSERGGLTC